MYVQPLDGSLNPNPLASFAANPEANSPFTPGAPVSSTGDNISRFVPPWLNQGDAPVSYGGEGWPNSGSLQGLFGPLLGVLQQLMQMLQSLMGYGCNSPYGYGGSPPGSGNERFFQNAKGASEGDPHLSFNGEKWNAMASQPDLLNSNSFPGGFRISTQVTPPNSKGATWNQSATVAINGGASTVAMNDSGTVTVTNCGQPIPIAKGQTVQLGNGDSVTYEQNGSLDITAENGYGGRIDTTLTPQGQGVNVDVTAHDVDLGGALINGYENHGEPNPTPVPYEPAPEPLGQPPPAY